jgi:hypothetical protein
MNCSNIPEGLKLAYRLHNQNTVVTNAGQNLRVDGYEIIIGVKNPGFDVGEYCYKIIPGLHLIKYVNLEDLLETCRNNNCNYGIYRMPLKIKINGVSYNVRQNVCTENSEENLTLVYLEHINANEVAELQATFTQ